MKACSSAGRPSHSRRSRRAKSVNAGRQSGWNPVGASGATVTTPYALPNGAIATSSAVSKGYALEVYFRPNRNWDFVASVDQTEARVSGIAPELSDFFATRGAFYKKYFDEGMRVDGTTSRNPPTSQLRIENFRNAVGIISGNANGLKGIAIYLPVYTFMNLGAMGVIVSLRRKDIIGDEIDDLAGLVHKEHVHAIGAVTGPVPGGAAHHVRRAKDRRVVGGHAVDRRARGVGVLALAHLRFGLATYNRAFGPQPDRFVQLALGAQQLALAP